MCALLVDMEKFLESITKWLRQSSLKINEEKTEVCLFNRLNVATIVINLGNAAIASIKSKNLLGEIVDLKLNWSEQVANIVIDANKTLN
jgi:hypothetical protein